MQVMESFLRRRGHHVRDWGLGRNSGEAKQLRMALVPVVDVAVAAHGEPVTLVGWSLGGFIAREFARERPSRVRKVITLGSPVIGGPRYTATASGIARRDTISTSSSAAVAARYAAPIRCR